MKMTLGELRRSLEQIGKGHDNKPVAILTTDGKVHYLDCVIACQGDRILIDAKKSK
jgi:hypothetical protein